MNPRKYVPSRLVTLDNFPFENSDETDENYDCFEKTDFTEIKDDPESMEELSFHCSSCSYQTSIESLYERHVAKHALAAPYLCTVCPYSDYDHGSFVDHIATHQHGRILKCSFCSYMAIRNSMKIHMLKHRSVDMLDCSMCEFSTNYPNAMRGHVETYHTREYTCEYCQNVMSKYSLIKHSWNVHGLVIKTKLKSLNELGYGLLDDPTNYESRVITPRLRGPELPCGTSSRPQTQDVNEYVKPEPESESDMKQEEPDQDERSTPSNSKPAQPKHYDKWIGKFDCEFCGFTTKYFTSKRSHVEKFHTKLFSCSHCDRSMTKHDLGVHCKEVHGFDLNMKHGKNKRFMSALGILQEPEIPSSITEDSSASAECNGPSIIEAVKSASRKPKRKYGFDEVAQKTTSEGNTCTPGGTVPNSPCKVETQETSDERDSLACESADPFVSIAEAVKAKSRKGKRRTSSSPSVTSPGPSVQSTELSLQPAPELSCATSSGPLTRNVGTSIDEESSIFQDSPVADDKSLDQEPSIDDNSLAQVTSQEPGKCDAILEKSGEPEYRAGYLYCSNCRYKTRLKSLMRKHVVSHLPESHLVCPGPDCNFSTDLNYTFARHLRFHSQGFGAGVIVHCCFCHYSTPAKSLGNLSNHLASHKNVGSFYCSKCSYSTTVRKPLRDHLRSYHLEKYQCPNCPKVATRFRIQKHMKECIPGINMKPISLDLTKPEVTVKEENLDDLGVEESVPDISERNDTSNYVNHGSNAGNCSNSKVTDPLVMGAQEVRINPNLQAQSLFDSKTNFYCSECPYNTKKKRLLRKHVAKHLCEGSFFRCPECHIKDNNPREFTLHLKMHGIDLTTCCFCGSTFRAANERAFADHLELHRPVHFMDCPNCDKTCKRLGDLRNHFYTYHISKRRCSVCNKRMTRYKLLRHMATHRPARSEHSYSHHASDVKRKPHAPVKTKQADAQDCSVINDGLLFDGIVDECFSVPLSPNPNPSTGPLLNEQDSNDWGTGDSSQPISSNTARPEDLSSNNVPNSSTLCSDNDLEDPWDVPIFDISEAPFNCPDTACTDTPAQSTTRVPMLWDTLGIDIFKEAHNNEYGSGPTLPGDGSDHGRMPSPSVVQVVHHLDHNYAAKSEIGEKEL